MRSLVLLLACALTGCLTSSSAYRARFTDKSEVAGLKQCAAQCDKERRGTSVGDCLANCPGFTAEPGDRCTPRKEKPGTYCVTVETRLYPDLAFWASVAEAAAESKDDDDKEEAKDDKRSEPSDRSAPSAERKTSEDRSAPKERAAR